MWPPLFPQSLPGGGHNAFHLSKNCLTRDAAVRQVHQLEPPDVAITSHSFELFYAATMSRTLVAALRTTTNRDIAHRATQHAYAVMLGQWHDLQSEPWPESARHVLALATRTAATSSRRPASTIQAGDDREQRLDDEFELHWPHVRDGLRELAATARPPRSPGFSTVFSALVAGGDPGSRRAIIGWLTRMGADPVQEAATVDEAKARTHVSGPCDLALVDLDLPHGGALELVTDLRLLGWRRIVVLASPDDSATVPQAFRAGAQACLLKLAPPGSGELRLVLDDTTQPDQDTAMRTVPRPAARNKNPYGLSDREIEVLQLVAAGHSNKEIGETLNLSALTIGSHLTRAGRKLGTGNRARMVAHAMRARIIH